MKKIFLLMMLLLVTSIAIANINYESKNDGLVIHYNNEKQNPSDETLIIALPSESVSVKVNLCEISIFDDDNNFIENRIINGDKYVEIVNSFIMRELYGHQINMKTSSTKKGEKQIVKLLEIELTEENSIIKPNTVSPAFLPIYKSFVDNYETSYLRGLDQSVAKMLIITHESLLPYLDYFTDWKHACGIATDIAIMSDIGTTNQDLKNYIQDIYDTSDNPPDYILITGDVDDDFAIPAFYINSGTEENVTDHPYTLLAGDDYLPEMITGRLSIDGFPELQTIIAKILFYEKQPFMQEDHWFKNATIVAGNYSPTPPMPSTPVKVSKWFRDKLLDNDYNNIDEIYYPPTYPGTSQITSSINAGVGIVSYRGWGDANGWHYPRYHLDDMVDIDNGKMMPVIASFVCNTGDFASSVDPCFGEKWLRMGNPSAPKGGVIFIGPSDLHTKTKFNNSIFSGFVYGIYDEDIFSFGTAILRGKMELYNNFPLNQGSGGDVEFYFNVYNILGDPSLKIWTDVPAPITCDLPTEVNIGTNYLQLDLQSYDGAVVTAIKGDEFFSTEIVENGFADVYFDSQTAGEIEITITKGNHHPFIQSIDVVAANVDIGLNNVETDGALIAGQNNELTITLENFGSETAINVIADLTTENSDINIVTSSANYGHIASGATATNEFEIEVLAQCPDNSVIEFDLELSTGNTLKFELLINGIIIEVTNVTIDNGNLEPGQDSTLEIEIENLGTFDVSGVTAILTTESEEITINSASVSFGNVSTGGSAIAEFSVSVSEFNCIGNNILFQLDITDENDLLTIAYFNLEVGEPTVNAPTGPDNFGYYAYDSNDIFFTECPTYEWIEIDPQEGGNGQVFELGDDSSVTIPMPFDFPFYGEISDSLTICTNGWVSMHPTWETYFRNWNIPSALGPYGMIAPYWDDLIGEEIGNEIFANMRICTYYDETENIFIVEWNECINRVDMISVEKFELILYDPISYPTASGNGEIQFNYKLVNNPDFKSNYVTVGIENFTQSDGVLYTYANIYPNSALHLQDNMSIKFTTDIPEYYGIAIPQTDFSSDTTAGIAPVEVKFHNDTSPAYYFNEYEWNFGDGSNVSSEIHPIHVFEEEGTYDVSLIATNSEGTDTQVHQDYIQVLNGIIWPGDANNDGVTNEADILAIGTHWRKSGNAREEISFVWDESNYPGEWEEPLASYADCNGDGEVNIADVLGICLNWNLTHTGSRSFSGYIDGIAGNFVDNFRELYENLENSGTQLLMKNHIAERFGFPIVTPEVENFLTQNYPNPFNPTTTIKFSLADEVKNARIEIFNVKGQRVKTYQINQLTNTLVNQIVWNGKDENNKDIGSGIYFYKLINNNEIIDTKKMLLLK